MEPLNWFLVKAREGGFISGFLVGGRGSGIVELTHLLCDCWEIWGGKWRLDFKGAKGSGVAFWKVIRKNWKVFRNRVCFIIRNRRRIKFWLDKWCGDTSLKESSPPYLPSPKGFVGCRYLEEEGDLGHWSSCFLR